MNIRVRLFGPAAIAAGSDSIAVSAGEITTCGSLLAAIAEQAPELLPFTKVGRLAVNAAYAEASAKVAANDEVALISMVSGG